MMMMELGLIVFGVACLMMGIILSVWEEWPRQGIGDTSFASLFLWLAGGLSLLATTGLLQEWLLLAAVAAPTAIILYWILHKWHMRRRARHR